MTSWWFNELGMHLHLACGREGRYEVDDNRHYIACRPCGSRRRVPAPSPAYAHFTYGRPS